MAHNLIIFLLALYLLVTNVQGDNDGPLRAIYLMQYLKQTDAFSLMGTGNGGNLMRMNVGSMASALFMEETPLDPMISVAGSTDTPGPMLSVFDRGTGLPFTQSHTYPNGLMAQVTRLGVVHARNSYLLKPRGVGDTSPGGLITRLWGQNPNYDAATNDINDFMRRVHGYMFAEPGTDPARVSFPGPAGTIDETYRAYREITPWQFLDHTDGAPVSVRPAGRNGPMYMVDSAAVYERERPTLFNPTPIREGMGIGDESGPRFTNGNGWQPHGGAFKPVDYQQVEAAENLLMLCRPVPARRLRSRRSLARSSELSRRQTACSPQDEANSRIVRGPRTLVNTRVGGVARIMVSMGARAALVGGAAATVFGMIVDFVQGEWKSALMNIPAGIAGSAIGSATGLATAGATIAGFSAGGPIGIAVGVAFTALFMIIPGLFMAKQPPPSDNIIQIIRWQWFGDVDHTGDEKCNQNLQENGQEPNCTISYGLGAISGLLKLKAFEGAAYLDAFNEGQAMTIPDMAQTWKVYDYNDPAATANAPAVIDCGLSQCKPPGAIAGWGPGAAASSKKCSPQNGYACPHPEFKINLSAITLHNLNQTADKIGVLVESGECKISSDPVEGRIIYLPEQTGDYDNATSTSEVQTVDTASTTIPKNATDPTGNSTASDEVYGGGIQGPWKLLGAEPMNYTGAPIAIACNVTANIPNVIDPNYNFTRNTYFSAPNESTDGLNHFVAPPPPAPFIQLSPDNSVCLSGEGYNNLVLCLPNGTYPTCRGGFGYKTDKLNTAKTSIQGVNVTFDIESQSDSSGTDTTPQTDYDDIATADSADLSRAFSVATHHQDSFSIAFPLGMEPAPSMCVFSQVDFGGDVWCMGPGGTNFTDSLVNKVASLRLTTGLAAWLYPEFYGNPLGTLVSTSVSDLSSIPYKTDGDFKNIVAAAWIYNATAPPTRKVRRDAEVDYWSEANAAMWRAPSNHYKDR